MHIKRAGIAAGSFPEGQAVIRLRSETDSLLLVETEQRLGLDGGQDYEAIDRASEASAEPGVFPVFNHTLVTDDGREAFEAGFQARARIVEKEPGFLAIRVLRPLQSDIYIIWTQCQSEEHFPRT